MIVRRLALIGANVIGLVAFTWPFVLPAAGTANVAHASDAPWILVALVVFLGLLLFAELGRPGLGAKVVALVGVLGGCMVALRLPGFVAGFSAMFVVVILAGNALGSSFGFVLGSVGTFASALFVGGIGPWLPFQMVAVGWLGLGAGALPRKRSWRVRLGALAVYAFVSGYAFGGVMNLWFWPFLASGGPFGWDGGASLVTNAAAYGRFYLATSLVWDSFRAVGTAALVILLGRSVLPALDRAGRRMTPTFEPPPAIGTVPSALNNP